MDAALIWYGLWLLLIATVFWAAVWWWLPAIFREPDGKHRERALGEHRRELNPEQPGADTRGGAGASSDTRPGSGSPS